VVAGLAILGVLTAFLLAPIHVQQVMVNITTITGFYAGLVFVGGYHLLTLGKWRQSGMGINVMMLCGSVTGLFGLRCLALLLGDGYPGQLLARQILFALIVGALIWRTRIMVRAQMANLSSGEEPHDVD